MIEQWALCLDYDLRFGLFPSMMSFRVFGRTLSVWILWVNLKQPVFIDIMLILLRDKCFIVHFTIDITCLQFHEDCILSEISTI